MSMRVATVILVAVVVVVGLSGYVVLQYSSSTTTTTSPHPCSPVIACCTGCIPPPTLLLFIPYAVAVGQTYAEVAAGVSVPAVVDVNNFASVRNYSVTWAPGQSTTSSSGSLSHMYTTPGLYVVFANATLTNGFVVTGNDQLVVLQVNPSLASVISGDYPKVSLTVVNTTGDLYPVVAPGGSVTVTATYSAPPADALYSTVPPTLTIPAGATESHLITTSSSIGAKYTFPTPGYYPITLVAPVHGPGGTLYQNYTWGIYVGIATTWKCASACPLWASPHKNTVVAYELAPGGALDLDPAADYYSVGTEVGQSIDESLITFNGTDSGPTYPNFVPEVATCVPGSPQCAKLYGGNTLVQGSNYTFVIDKAAHFWDPYTSRGREVYPSDVMFSIIRAILYTQVFGVTGYYAGSDIAGPLVPFEALEPNEVDSNWDLGPGNAAIHAPYNNTPYYTLRAFAVNDTQWCPAIAMSQENGCITFHADADGKAWPALLQILTMISLDGIQEAGWYTAQGAEVPGFVCSATNVDAPCLLPGGTNTTNSTAYGTWVQNSLTGSSGADSPYGWDPEIAAGVQYPIPVPAVSFKEVGSGPYYLVSANSSVGYTLKANPLYEAPSGCAGQVGCLPLPSQYAQNVSVHWESSDTAGISEAEAGYADTASFETADYGTMLALVQAGQLGIEDVPTLATSNFGFNLHINVSVLKSWVDAPVNIPADAFAYEGLRATLEYAYPYQTAQAVGNVIDGIDLGNPFGGFLPPSETAFYDVNVPWPNYNITTQTFSNPNNGPATTAGTAAWYWAQAKDCPSGPLCDPELASFNSSNPLVIPVMGFVWAPNINAMEGAWGRSVTNITGGAVVFQQLYISPTEPDCFSYTSPGCLTPSYTIWPFFWTPDYPSPADNWANAYGGSGMWGSTDALGPTLSQGLYGGVFNDSTVCGHDNPTVANLSYWADQPDQVIPQVCQGTAFNITTYFANLATDSPNTTLGMAYWDMVQAVYNNLQLTIGATAANTLFTYAPWIAANSIDTNVEIGGSSEWAWYQLAGDGIY